MGVKVEKVSGVTVNDSGLTTFASPQDISYKFGDENYGLYIESGSVRFWPRNANILLRIKKDCTIDIVGEVFSLADNLLIIQDCSMWLVGGEPGVPY